METFLTKTSLKKVILLDYLLEKNNWCSMKELQNILRVTDKSILHYIEEVDNLFKRYDGQIVLMNDNNKQFFIKKEQDFPIYNVYLYFYKSSYNYHLIDFMYHYPEKSLQDFADQQFTSVSTVFRYAKLLVPYFKRYRIDFQTFKLKLNADEIKIRCFYYYFYWNSTRESLENWPFDIEIDRINSYIAAFEKIYHVVLGAFQKRVFSYWLAINLERRAFSKVIVTKQYESLIKSDPYFELLKNWRRKIQIEIEDHELYFLYQIIYCFGIIDGNKKYENQYADNHRSNLTCSYRAVEHLKHVLNKEFVFELNTDDPELLFNFIAFHERSRLFFGNTDLFFNRSYREEIKEESPKKFRVMEKFYNSLKKVNDSQVLNLLNNWEQLFLDYYYILDYYQLFLSHFKPIKILIQDDLHHTHRLWLMNKIQSSYGHSYVFAFYDYRTKFTDVDLVISNYYLNTESTPLILMKNIPTERNWLQLGTLLYELSNK